MNIIKHIPNTITSMNLLCGVLGVIFTFQDRFDVAFPLMLAAAVFDFCDGLAARLLNAYSPMGKELDSLADMVSFGVLPATMMHRLMTMAGVEGFWCWIPLAIAVFSGLRLAKFNIDERQSDNFIGLATPACAMICGALAYFVSSSPESAITGLCGIPYVIPAVSIVLSLLLTSEIPMFSMKIKKNMKPTPQDRFRIIFLVLIVAITAAVLIAGMNWSMIVLLTFVCYILLNCILAVIK